MDTGYLWLKILHLLGVVAFLGNIIITGWWRFMADRTRNPQIIAFERRQVTITDDVLRQAEPPSFWLQDTALHGMDLYNVR